MTSERSQFFITVLNYTNANVQGISKRLFPGWVKSSEKVVFCLLSAGRKMQYFHHIFSQPGKNLLEISCSYQPHFSMSE